MEKPRLPSPPEPRSRPSNRKLRKQAENPAITGSRVTLLPGFLRHGVRSETVQRSRSPEAYDAEVLSENLHGLLRRSTRLAGKSVFREIRERYARRLGPVNGDFGARLFAALRPGIAVPEAAHFKRAVREAAAAVDAALRARPAMAARKRPLQGAEESRPPRLCVPPARWVFQTPPNRKLHRGAHVEEASLRPAVLETRGGAKAVYEMSSEVDLSRCSSRQELAIDERYMVEVTDSSFQEEKADPFELEDHFLSLTCRPKKAPCAVSRLPMLKRKRDIFEPEAAGAAGNEFDSSFTFINNSLSGPEESFTFKFTADEGATTGHIFDFDGNKKDTFDVRY